MPRPQQDLIDTMQLTDREIKYVMNNAAREADRILRDLGDDMRPGARLRSSQIALARAQADAWRGVADAVRVGIGDAFDASTSYQALFDQRLIKAAGISPAYWEQSMLATARSGLGQYIARKENGFTLSDRVYRNTAISKGFVDRAINNGLILGKSAKEIAKDVVGFIDPNTPGGASYAAMRLGRTELQNAFHTQSKNMFAATPWITHVKWWLSGSHERPDACNDYADSSHYRGGEAGVFLAMEVPDKPHPNCLCYTTPEVMDLDQYAKNFKAGQYDDYINEQMGCSRVA
jgi:hypothetical protein